MENSIRTAVPKWLVIGIFSAGLLLFGMTFAEAGL